MTGREEEAVSLPERNLLWLGYEDYTGLWQVVIELRDTRSNAEAQDYARQVLELLLNRGWIELYVTDGALDNETIAPVPHEERTRVLWSDTSWSSSGEKLVWFGTTDRGHSAYEAVGRPQGTRD